MEQLETSGVVIGAQSGADPSKAAELDVFTVDFGIMKFFNRARLPIGTACLFEDMELSGERITATAGKLYAAKLHSQNYGHMLQNGSHWHGKMLVDTMRSIVFDGVPMDNMFTIVKQAIRNFSNDFDPNAVLLKGLYLICREEGYGVDAYWLNSLAAEDRTLAKGVIFSKLPASTGNSDGTAQDASPMRALINSLRNWALSI